MKARDVWILLALSVVANVVSHIIVERWIAASRPRPRLVPFTGTE